MAQLSLRKLIDSVALFFPSKQLIMPQFTPLKHL